MSSLLVFHETDVPVFMPTAILWLPCRVVNVTGINYLLYMCNADVVSWFVQVYVQMCWRGEVCDCWIHKYKI